MSWVSAACTALESFHIIRSIQSTLSHFAFLFPQKFVSKNLIVVLFYVIRSLLILWTLIQFLQINHWQDRNNLCTLYTYFQWVPNICFTSVMMQNSTLPFSSLIYNYMLCSSLIYVKFLDISPKPIVGHLWLHYSFPLVDLKSIYFENRFSVFSVKSLHTLPISSLFQISIPQLQRISNIYSSSVWFSLYFYYLHISKKRKTFPSFLVFRSYDS